jgi:hypothetical protein
MRPLHGLFRRAIALCLGVAFLSTGSSMAMLLATAPAAEETSHHSSHDSRPEHQHPGHHETDCCSYCTVHCSAHFGLLSAKLPPAPAHLIESVVGFAGRAAPAIARARHLHPPSQAPPTLLD